MKPTQRLAIVLLCLTGMLASAWLTSKHDKEVLQARVYTYFGEGDQGEEVNYYLQTGDTSFALEWQP